MRRSSHGSTSADTKPQYCVPRKIIILALFDIVFRDVIVAETMMDPKTPCGFYRPEFHSTAASHDNSVWIYRLGQMGSPMACNLAREVLSKSSSKDRSQAQSVLAAGANHRRNRSLPPSGIRQTVFLCVPNGDVVEQILFGDFGLANALPAGALWTSIRAPSNTQGSRDPCPAYASMGIGFIDATVSACRHGAEAGTLTMMCGQPKRKSHHCRRLLATMASPRSCRWGSPAADNWPS